ncbi:hypothetical protein [Campylobacter showae]|uniref:hypothetical protein n=1 Tax=Campylobacter showae TaxID=204 RepID=UPI001F14437D|nr:hypothetical protein [Campylobacter showae]
MSKDNSQAMRILNLGVEEIFEDLTYNVAYDVVLKKLKDNGMDDGILKDAIESGITIMFSSALMLYIQKQEEVIHKILGVVVSLLGVILNPFASKVKGLARKFFKGAKAGIISKFLGVSAEARVGYANVVVNGTNAVFNSSQSSSQNNGYVSNIIKQKEALLHSKDQQLAYAKAKADSFNQTLMFKLLTSKFTATDKELLRKITGSSSIDIEQINKVADFMWVKDDKGDIVGLSEAFMQMLNGLGYFHNKVKAGGA